MQTYEKQNERTIRVSYAILTRGVNDHMLTKRKT